MSQIEAIGAILARAQIIEEAMRMLIVAASNNYEHPREVKGTFGKILRRFEQLYPSEEALISLLRTARDARNDAAHSDLLVAGFINELLSGEDPAAVARFQGRTVRRTIEGMDWAMRAILGFLRAHGLQVDPVASPAAVDLDETDRQTDRDAP